MRLEDKGLVVRSLTGAQTRIDLADVLAANFRDTPAPTGAREGALQPGVQGLRGEYCSDTQFKNVRMVRADPDIRFEWTETSRPDASLDREFSVRWVGTIEAAYDEVYTFHLRVVGGGWLWVDGKLVVGRMQGSDGTFTGAIALKRGRKYDLKLEFHAKGNAKCRLSWSSAHQPAQFVPASALRLPAGTTAPAVQMLNPVEGARLASSYNVLEAAASDDVRRVEFFCDDRAIGEVQRAPWRLEWRNAANGARRLHAKATSISGISAITPPVNVIVVPQVQSLPGPWAASSAEHRVEHVEGRFTVRSARGELFVEHERFQFVYQPLAGDGTIVARLAEFDPGDGAAWAGLLIRENPHQPKAKQAFLGLMWQGGLGFGWREEMWTQPGWVEDKATAPIWLKLVRFGDVVKAYRSTDGEKWRMMAERRIRMEKLVSVGIVVCCTSRQNGSAAFDHVLVSRGSPKLQTSVKGIMLRSGSVVAGGLNQADETAVKLSRSSETIVPSAQVARILFRPLTADMAARLENRDGGILLGNGDFVDGRVQSIRNGQIRINSVLLGARRFNTEYPHDVIAVVLHDVNLGSCAYEVRGADGSIMRATRIAIEQGKLRTTDANDVTVLFSPGEIADITAQDQDRAGEPRRQ